MRRYPLLALLLFSTGFLLFHGREAAHSGSWDFIITHDDEYIYWALARGSMEQPAADANPFYYEERLPGNPLPAYLTVTAAGKLAAALGIGVLSLLPAWKILMPFSLWLALFLCLVRLWGRAPGESAALALLVLLSTLFMHGAAQFTLFRFPRPGDGLGLVLLWLSLLVHADKMSARRYVGAMLATGLATMALTPYFTILQVWTLGLQWAYEGWVRRDWSRARPHLVVLAVLFAGACGYLAFILASLDESFWIRAVLDVDRKPERYVHFPSLALYAVVCLGTWAMHRRTGDLTRFDRLVLFVVALDPLTANVRLVLGQDHQIGLHRYYFLVPQIACLLGWAIEKAQILVRDAVFRRIAYWPVLGLVWCEAFVLGHTGLNYFRLLPRDESTFRMYDHSLLLLFLLPPILLGPWAFARFARFARLLRRPLLAGAALALIALAGYGLRESQLQRHNRAIPFSGAYTWLSEHGVEDAVMLTGPSRYTNVDYSMFYADVRPYYNTNGQRFSGDPAAKEHRRFVSAALISGGLPFVLLEFPTIAAKLRHLKLDYVLVARPGPFADKVRKQLAGHINEVYRDERCILWRVVLPE